MLREYFLTVQFQMSGSFQSFQQAIRVDLHLLKVLSPKKNSVQYQDSIVALMKEMEEKYLEKLECINCKGFQGFDRRVRQFEVFFIFI